MKKSSLSKKQTAKKRVVWFSWQPLIIALLGLFVGVGIVAQVSHQNCFDENGNSICNKVNISEESLIEVCEDGYDATSGDCLGGLKEYKVKNHTGELVSNYDPNQSNHTNAKNAGFSGDTPKSGYHQMDQGTYSGKWIGINMEKANGEPDFNIYETKPRRIFIPHRTKEEFLRFLNATKRTGENPRDVNTGAESSTALDSDGKLAHKEGEKPGIEICEVYPGTSDCKFVNCGDTFADPRDGKLYGTKKIGNQCWFTEDLEYTNMTQGQYDYINDEFHNIGDYDTIGYAWRWDGANSDLDANGWFKYGAGTPGETVSPPDLIKDLCYDVLPEFTDDRSGESTPYWNAYAISIDARRPTAYDQEEGSPYNSAEEDIYNYLNDDAYEFRAGSVVLTCERFRANWVQNMSGDPYAYDIARKKRLKGIQDYSRVERLVIFQDSDKNYSNYMKQEIPNVTDTVCPTGWHVPIDAEWKNLEIALGMSSYTANILNGYSSGDPVSGFLNTISTRSSGNTDNTDPRLATNTTLLGEMGWGSLSGAVRYLVQDEGTYVTENGDGDVGLGVGNLYRTLSPDGANVNFRRAIFRRVNDPGIHIVFDLFVPKYFEFFTEVIAGVYAAEYDPDAYSQDPTWDNEGLYTGQTFTGRVRCVQGTLNLSWGANSCVAHCSYPCVEFDGTCYDNNKQWYSTEGDSCDGTSSTVREVPKCYATNSETGESFEMDRFHCYNDPDLTFPGIGSQTCESAPIGGPGL